MTTGAAASPNDSPSDKPTESGTTSGVSQHKETPFQMPVQRKVDSSTSPDIAPFQLKKSSSDGGMPEDVRGKMENAFQADFSNVNVHQNSQSATDVGALAYAQGNDVHFAPGQFKPETQSGQELIGHELTHVVQQREGRVKPTTQAGGMPVNDDKGLEKEADVLGKKAAQGKFGGEIIQKKQATINTGRVVQRDKIPSEEKPVNDTKQEGIVTGSRVKIRPQPNTNNNNTELGFVSNPTRVTILEETKPEGSKYIWYKIRTEDKKLTGWIRGDFIQILKPQTLEEQSSSLEGLDNFLETRQSKHGSGVACIVFIHNNEKSAKAVANEMHNKYNVNLAIINDGKSREIPMGNGTIDPNGLFDPKIMKSCNKNIDQINCGASKTESTKDRTQKQFYLAILEMSNYFQLPVVALHNNSVNDTNDSDKGIAAKGSYNSVLNSNKGEALKTAISALNVIYSARNPIPAIDNRINPLSKISELRSILDKFNINKKTLMEKAGQTNIFRWCNAAEIGYCHIGDPGLPDHVIWTTNPDDFVKLSKTSVNVALQVPTTSSKSESDTDLSSVFLPNAAHLKSLRQELDTLKNNEERLQRLQKLITELEKLKKEEGDEKGHLQDRILGLTILQNAVLKNESLQSATSTRYINIEVPHGEKKGTHMTYIQAVLKSLGINVEPQVKDVEPQDNAD